MTGRMCAGVDCRLRQVDKDNSAWGYCEGCPDLTRWCPSCETRRPQSGWWWGRRGLRVDVWVCSSCRFDLPSLWAELPASGPMRGELTAWMSTHPQMVEVLASRSTFTAGLVVSDEVRYEVARDLDKAAGTTGVDPLGWVAAAVRTTTSGDVAVDVADLDMPTRIAVGEALHTVAYRSDWPSERSRDVLAGLVKAWNQWVSDHVPAVAPRPLLAERERAERERRLAGLDGV